MIIHPGDIVKNKDGRVGIVIRVDERKTLSILERRCLVLLEGKVASILLRNLFKIVRH